MTRIISVAEVRAVSGATTDLIGDTDVETIIDSVQIKTESMFGVKLTPTTKIEITEGEYKDKLLVDEYYPLTLYSVNNGSTEVDVKDLFVDTETGFIKFYGDSITGGYGYPYSTTRFSFYELNVKLKYLYGMIERDTTVSTDTTAATSSGSSVEIEVTSSADFTIGQYVFIEDTNRAKEVFKITGKVDTTHITAEILVNDYESGALVTASKTLELFKQFVLYESAMAVMASSIGSSYTFATSWSQEGESATLGVPYPHFDKSVQVNTKRRDEVMQQIQRRLATIV